MMSWLAALPPELIVEGSRIEGLASLDAVRVQVHLAARFLPEVQAPTLLVVGGRDTVVLELNQEAFSLLRCEKALAVIPGATHLFEEPGALERAAELAALWFDRQLPPAAG